MGASHSYVRFELADKNLTSTYELNDKERKYIKEIYFNESLAKKIVGNKYISDFLSGLSALGFNNGFFRGPKLNFTAGWLFDKATYNIVNDHVNEYYNNVLTASEHDIDEAFNIMAEWKEHIEKYSPFLLKPNETPDDGEYNNEIKRKIHDYMLLPEKIPEDLNDNNKQARAYLNYYISLEKAITAGTNIKTHYHI